MLWPPTVSRSAVVQSPVTTETTPSEPGRPPKVALSEVMEPPARLIVPSPTVPTLSELRMVQDGDGPPMSTVPSPVASAPIEALVLMRMPELRTERKPSPSRPTSSSPDVIQIASPSTRATATRVNKVAQRGAGACDRGANVDDQFAFAGVANAEVAIDPLDFGDDDAAGGARIVGNSRDVVFEERKLAAAEEQCRIIATGAANHKAGVDAASAGERVGGNDRQFDRIVTNEQAIVLSDDVGNDVRVVFVRAEIEVHRVERSAGALDAGRSEGRPVRGFLKRAADAVLPEVVDRANGRHIGDGSAEGDAQQHDPLQFGSSCSGALAPG